MVTRIGRAILSWNTLMVVIGALPVVVVSQWGTLRDAVTGPDLSDISSIVSAAREISDTPLGPPPNPFGTDDDWLCSSVSKTGQIVPASEILKSLGYDT